MEPPQEIPKSEGEEKEEVGEELRDLPENPPPHDSSLSSTSVLVDNPTKPSDDGVSEVKSDEVVETENAPLENGTGNENEGKIGGGSVEVDEKKDEGTQEEGDQEKISNLVAIQVKPGGEGEAVSESEKEKEKDQLDDRTETENENETGSTEMDVDVEKPEEDKKVCSDISENPVKSEGEEETEKTLTENESKMKSGNESLEKDENKAVDNTDKPAQLEDNNGDDEDQIGSSRFDYWSDGNESGDEEEQTAFMVELENFHKENNLEFKHPKFYGIELNLLKLWRHVIKLGCYEKVTSQKFWRQVGESFNPPKTCTTVSWTFRIFYEKALLEYEKHKIRNREIEAEMPDLTMPPMMPQVGGGNEGVSGGGGSGSGRARRDAATRAMEGWHSHRPLGNGQVSDPFIKDRSGGSLSKRDKFVRTSGGTGTGTGTGSVKRKRPDESDNKMALAKPDKSQMDASIVDAGLPADWVKINVKKSKDCYEVYALVPGLLREEVQVKSDPAGRLIVSGEPEQPDNPWGITPFKKVITLPSPIDPHQTSAVVTLHGQLYVRAPFRSSN